MARFSAPEAPARRIADLVAGMRDPLEAVVAAFEAPGRQWTAGIFSARTTARVGPDRIGIEIDVLDHARVRYD